MEAFATQCASCSSMQDLRQAVAGEPCSAATAHRRVFPVEGCGAMLPLGFAFRLSCIGQAHKALLAQLKVVRVQAC